MIHRALQNQEIDVLHINPLISKHFQFQVIEVKILVLDIVIVIEKLILFKLHQVEDTLTFRTDEEL